MIPLLELRSKLCNLKWSKYMTWWPIKLSVYNQLQMPFEKELIPPKWRCNSQKHLFVLLVGQKSPSSNLSTYSKFVVISNEKINVNNTSPSAFENLSLISVYKTVLILTHDFLEWEHNFKTKYVPKKWKRGSIPHSFSKTIKNFKLNEYRILENHDSFWLKWYNIFIKNQLAVN